MKNAISVKHITNILLVQWKIVVWFWGFLKFFLIWTLWCNAKGKNKIKKKKYTMLAQKFPSTACLKDKYNQLYSKVYSTANRYLTQELKCLLMWVAFLILFTDGKNPWSACSQPHWSSSLSFRDLCFTLHGDDSILHLEWALTGEEVQDLDPEAQTCSNSKIKEHHSSVCLECYQDITNKENTCSRKHNNRINTAS